MKSSSDSRNKLTACAPAHLNHGSIVQPETSSPFVIGRMIKEPTVFHGRSRELQLILNRLQKRESTSIVGPRRIGKSSIAYHVLSNCATRLSGNYEFVWLDGQSSNLVNVNGFCSVVATTSSIQYQPGSTTHECLLKFEQAIRAAPKHVVLIINEFEVLTDQSHRNEFGVPFFNTMRLLAEQGFCSLLTTSYTPLQQVCKHVLEVSSPFYNIFEELVLQHFTNAEAESFLKDNSMGVVFTSQEIDFIRKIRFYEHPLVLQIAADSVLSNRIDRKGPSELRKNIEKRVEHYLTHAEVQEGRRVAKEDSSKGTSLSKPLDLTVSILIPVLGIGLFMLEFGILMRYLTNFQAVLLSIATAIIGFAVLIFAGRSIDIIGETTFFKLFSSIIEQIPLLSNLLSTATKVGQLATGTATPDVDTRKDPSNPNSR